MRRDLIAIQFAELCAVALALFGLGYIVILITGCSSPPRPPSQDVVERSSKYGVELAKCTAESATLDASIACENGVRAKYGRPPRPLPDGGV